MIRRMYPGCVILIVFLALCGTTPCISREDTTDSVQTYLQQAREHIARTPWKSIGPATQALEIATSQHDDEAAAEAHILLARARLSMQQNDKALDHLMEALNLYESLGLKEKQAKALQGIGIVYDQAGGSEKAFRYLQDALNLYKESGNRQQIARVYISIGIHYSKTENTDKALEYYEKALAMQGKLNDPVGLAATLSNVATVYQKRKEYGKAIELYKRVLALGERVEIGTRVVAIAQNNLGECYIKTGDLGQAEHFLTESLKATELISALDIMVPTLNALVDLKTEQHRYKEALDYAKQLITYDRRLNEEQSKDRIAAIESTHELQAKEDAIRVLKQENEIHQLTIQKNKTNRTILIFAIVFVTGLALALLGLYISRTRRNRIIRQKNRELQEALDHIELLTGMLPICANCKKVRDDKGYWVQVEQFVSEHTKATFSHGICPDCKTNLYGNGTESE